MFSIILAHLKVYWTLGVVFSVYYGARGIVIEARSIEEQKKQSACWERVFVHYIHKFILNAFGSFVGFGALFLISEVYAQLGSPPKIDTGTAIFLGFLGLVVITGITGILPEILYRGQLFGSRS